MANLQIKGVEEDFYEDLKRLAAASHRSVGGTVLAALEEYLTLVSNNERHFKRVEGLRLVNWARE